MHEGSAFTTKHVPEPQPQYHHLGGEKFNIQDLWEHTSTALPRVAQTAEHAEFCITDHFWQGFFNGSVGKESTRHARYTGDMGLISGWQSPLVKEMATHPSILAWRIPWTGEPDRVQLG